MAHSMQLAKRSKRRAVSGKDEKWKVKMEVALHGQWNVMFGQGVPAHWGMFRFPLLGDATYVGELLRGKRHGTGTHYGHSGTYIGDFRNGMMHGVGRREYCDGGIYEGGWKRGMKEGHGTLMLPNGDKYEGLFSKGMMHGAGVLHLSNGDRFEGGFVLGNIEGEGSYFFRALNGKYEGEFEGNELHGKGMLKYSNGDDEYMYFGRFERGMMHGLGEMRLGCGDAYTGEFQNGAMCGQGVYNSASGARYEGSFVGGLPHGYGRLDTGPGHHRGSFREPMHPPFSHIGNWRDGVPHGRGQVRVYDKNGDAEVLEGEWKDGLREGSFSHRYPWGREILEVFRGGERVGWSAAHSQDEQAETTAERPQHAAAVERLRRSGGVRRGESDHRGP